jgi:hypothetical protein
MANNATKDQMPLSPFNVLSNFIIFAWSLVINGVWLAVVGCFLVMVVGWWLMDF